MYFRAPKTWTRRVPSFLVKMAYGNVVHWVKVKTIMWRKNALILTDCFPTSGSQAWLSCLYCIRNLTWSKVLQLLGFKLACSENIVVVRITNIYTFLQSKLWILQPSAVGGHAAPVPQQALQSIITTIRSCTWSLSGHKYVCSLVFLSVSFFNTNFVGWHSADIAGRVFMGGWLQLL